MERKIGEIFEYNGEWYQCVKGDMYDYCKGCPSFENVSCTNLYGNQDCWLKATCEKLEKVGEPYVKRVSDGTFSTFQKYRVYNSVILPKDPYIYCNFIDGTIEIEIKQNKEDMEEKKDNYDGNMDKECIQICDVLNSISDVRTTESCCGHCKDRFMIFFTCDNPHSLAIIARVFDRRYIGTSQPWHIELQTKDSGAYDYFIHSETKYSSEEVMMKDVNKIIENIKYWCDDKFAFHFKGCDEKPTLTPFDINLAKAGKPVCTRDRRKARVLCYDFKQNEEYPILVAVENKDGKECALLYSNDGISEMYKSSNNELVMFPEKKEGWVNVYKECDGEYYVEKVVYKIKGHAVENASSQNYVGTVRIEFYE